MVDINAPKKIFTRQQLIDFCLTFPAAYEDYPFHNTTDSTAWTAMRHKFNKKTFAFIYSKDSKLCVNLKCDPYEADFLRQIFNDVQPAYHMNKTHWNTVIIGGDVPKKAVEDMVTASYNLIKPKIRQSKAKEEKQAELD